MPDQTPWIAWVNVTWSGLAWRTAVILGVPAAIVLADYFGWLIVNSGRIVYPLVFVGIVAVLMIDALRRRSGTAVYYWMALFMIGPTIVREDSHDTRETARWRIALIQQCTAASAQGDGPCDPWLVRADYEPCDFGATPLACRRELYRDAGWPEPSDTQQAATAP